MAEFAGLEFDGQSRRGGICMTVKLRNASGTCLRLLAWQWMKRDGSVVGLTLLGRDPGSKSVCSHHSAAMEFVNIYLICCSMRAISVLFCIN